MKIIDRSKIEKGAKYYRYQKLFRNRQNLTMKEAIENPKYDITYDLYHDLMMLIKNDRHVTITITGETASGKSTVGFWIAEYLLYCMQKFDKRKKALDFVNPAEPINKFKFTLFKGYDDMKKRYKRYEKQNEKMSFSEDYIYTLESYVSNVKNLKEQTVNVIDEGNRSRNFGVGGSVLYEKFNDFQDKSAQLYIHSIFISPNEAGITNPNSLFRIETKGIRYEEKTTQAVLYYEKNGFAKPLGSVMFDVSEILQRPYYGKYREQKMKYINLLKKHSINNINELMAYYKAWSIFKQAFMNDMDKKTIKTLINLKNQSTNTTSELIYRTVSSMLDLEKEYYKSKGDYDDEESYKQAKKDRLEGIKEGYYGNDMAKELYEQVFKHIKIYNEYFKNSDS